MREQVKAPVPKSVKKLRKQRKGSSGKTNKKRPVAPPVAVSTVSSSDSSSGSSDSSDEDSAYENVPKRKPKSNRKKPAARKASPVAKPREVVTKHCCEMLKSNSNSTHACPFAETSRPAETAHCCDTVRSHCCQNCNHPPALQTRSRFEDSWRSQLSRPSYNRSPLRPRENRRTSSPRQKSSPPAPAPTQQDKSPMIILLETPQKEPVVEPEYEEDMYGGQSIQIMLSQGGQFTSQMTAPNQFQQQPMYCYPNPVVQTAPPPQWPSPYYIYS